MLRRRKKRELVGPHPLGFPHVTVSDQPTLATMERDRCFTMRCLHCGWFLWRPFG